MVNAIPRPLYLRERAPVPSLAAYGEKKNLLPPTGLKPWAVYRQSEPLYRLRHSQSLLLHRDITNKGIISQTCLSSVAPVHTPRSALVLMSLPLLGGDLAGIRAKTRGIQVRLRATPRYSPMADAISENNTLLSCIFDYFSRRLEFKFSIVCTIPESAEERDSKIPIAMLTTINLEN